MKLGDKLYIITRRDLPPGQQAVQSCHALRQFVEEHPDLEQSWYRESNHLALLSVRNEAKLERLKLRAIDLEYKCSEFREPDRNHELTAIVLEPRAKRICRKIDLALKL